MKYLIAISKIFGFLILLFSTVLGFIYFLNDNSWWALPVVVIGVALNVIYLDFTEKKKCPKCKTKSRTTGMSGTKFKQWYCGKCNSTFWTTIFLEEYEHEIRK